MEQGIKLNFIHMQDFNILGHFEFELWICLAILWKNMKIEFKIRTSVCKPEKIIRPWILI